MVYPKPYVTTAGAGCLKWENRQVNPNKSIKNKNQNKHILLKIHMCRNLTISVLWLQADFDVRWCKGPVVERLFKPLIAKIEGMGGQILGGRRVQQVQTQGKAQGARLVSFACSRAHSVTHPPNDSIHPDNGVLFVFAAKAIAACSVMP